MKTTIKFYLSALFIALIAFGGTSFILRYRQAISSGGPAKLTTTQQAGASREEKRQRTGLTKISLRGCARCPRAGRALENEAGPLAHDSPYRRLACSLRH